MYYVKVSSARDKLLDYHTFETKAQALNYLDNNGYIRNVVNSGKPIKNPPDVFWNKWLQREAVIFSD